MNIGLVDIDGHNFPNLALMKLSAYHKAQGDKVEFYSIFGGEYDIVYKSKVFTYTNDYQYYINSKKIISGGTGYNYSIKLPFEVEHIMPDYSLYNETKAYGFLTRGCPNKCNWCIVPQKEGKLIENSDINEFWNGQKEVILLDNNVLASEHGLQQIEKIIKLGIKIDFNQGLDARIIAKDKSIAELLSKVKWSKYLRMACDTKSQIPHIEQAVNNLKEYGFKTYKLFFYVLVKDIPDALERIEYLKTIGGVHPFAQPYRDFTTNKQPTNEQRRFSRWVNHQAVFNTVEWSQYR
jgi:hypothetical protein